MPGGQRRRCRAPLAPAPSLDAGPCTGRREAQRRLRCTCPPAVPLPRLVLVLQQGCLAPGSPPCPLAPYSADRRIVPPLPPCAFAAQPPAEAESEFLEPFLRSLILGVGCAWVLESAHVALQFFGLLGGAPAGSLADLAAQLPAVSPPLFWEDHLAALAMCLVCYGLEAAAIGALSQGGAGPQGIEVRRASPGAIGGWRRAAVERARDRSGAPARVNAGPLPSRLPLPPSCCSCPRCSAWRSGPARCCPCACSCSRACCRRPASQQPPPPLLAAPAAVRPCRRRLGLLPRPAWRYPPPPLLRLPRSPPRLRSPPRPRERRPRCRGPAPPATPAAAPTSCLCRGPCPRRRSRRA